MRLPVTLPRRVLRAVTSVPRPDPERARVVGRTRVFTSDTPTRRRAFRRSAQSVPYPTNVRRPLVIPVAAACLLALAACSDADGSADTSSTAGSGDSPATTAEPPSAAGPQSITLAFGGDVHFERQVAGLLDASDEAWSKKLPALAAADYAIVNMEAAITDRGRAQSKPYTFRVPPSSLDKLKLAGVDAVTAANNHAVDYGRAGLEQTLELKKTSPIPIIGIGNNAAEAFAPLTVDIKGVNTAVLASSEIYEETYQNWRAADDHPGIATNIDSARLREATRKAAADHDLVVVFMHWGTEGSTCPNEQQQKTVRELKQDGADIIVGTHAHRPQGNGWSDRAFVGYGLGNFVWYNTSAESRPSGVLTVTVDAKAAKERGQAQGDARMTPESLVTDWTWTPKLISASGEPMSVTGASLERLEARAKAAQQCTDVTSKRPGA